ncbi:MAG: FAD-dependent oxidoreductase, partial [Syntrophobacteraceae bacterium]|nr:FAD-dependent oxidoreductase [Syntrophobacteraceae bacterium]
QKGALVICSTVVTDLLRDGSGKVIGVRTDRPEGDLRASVVLLSDGINSPLAAKTGFRPEPKPEDVALAVKETIALPEEVIDERFNVGPGQGVTTEILGEVTLGMNGVAFLYTNKASLSVGIGANLADFAARRVKPYEMLERFKAHPTVAPLIKAGKPREYLAHWLPEGGYNAIPQLCGDGFLVAGDSAMLFNAPHREGSNLAMASGRFAAEAIMEALQRGDFSRRSLAGYSARLESSFVIRDLKKYRHFPGFLDRHHEIFTTLPGAAAAAAREMIRVDGVPKRRKQQCILRNLRRRLPLLDWIRLLWDGWRAFR